jgi:ABC-2 type transport system permease protein
MMVIWIFFTFVIPQFADTQRNYAYAISNLSGMVTTVPTDTPVSKVIDFFSPAAQFTNLGNALLEADDTASSGFGALLLNQAPIALYLMAWSLLPLFGAFHAAGKEGELE